MREIKFRAVLIKKFNAKKPGKFVYFTLEELDHFYLVRLPIDWKTVQQFTGLKDKNGVEIYEGDVGKMILDVIVPQYVICEVEWNDEFASFSWKPIKRVNVSFAHSGWAMNNSDRFEVIGNIWEHPELLKEEV